VGVGPLRGLGVVAVLAAVALGGCADEPVATPTPDPAAVPSGSLQPLADEASGPVVELGQGQTLDTGWRYSIYPTGDEEWCTQLETSPFVTTSCHDAGPGAGGTFGVVTRSPDDAGAAVQTVDGVVSPDVATVWMVAEDSRRAPATLMSLEPAGLEGAAFVGFAPREVRLTHLQAVAANGEILETFELGQ